MRPRRAGKLIDPGGWVRMPRVYPGSRGNIGWTTRTTASRLPALAAFRSITLSDLSAQTKRTVTAFYDLMFNQCRPAEAIERYTGAVYIQHNPAVADGKNALIE